jgi:hypothetical protein
MDNPRAATKVVERIRYAAERLATFPYMGHEGLSVGTYEWVVAGLPYIIVTKPTKSPMKFRLLPYFMERNIEKTNGEGAPLFAVLSCP